MPKEDQLTSRSSEWELRRGEYSTWLIYANKKMILNILGYCPKDEFEAHARLIAAAPETAAERDRLRELCVEMLAALKRVMGAAKAGGCYLGSLPVQDAAYAIAKAEGVLNADSQGQ